MVERPEEPYLLQHLNLQLIVFKSSFYCLPSETIASDSDTILSDSEPIWSDSEPTYCVGFNNHCVGW
jgi:hypothetical protein